MNKNAKILIVEDEYVTAKTISVYLKKVGYHVVGAAMDIEEAQMILSVKEVDCVLLDINLNDEKDGIWLANFIKDKYNIPYLFLTAYTDTNTVNNAIASHPYGFLSKPFQGNLLYSALEIALMKHNELKNRKNISTESIFLKDVDVLKKVQINTIKYVESKGNYLDIHTQNKKYKHRGTLKDFLSLLPKQTFIQTHRGFVINTNMVTSFDKLIEFIYINEDQIPVSSRYRESVFCRINTLFI